MSAALTPKQRELLNFIRDYQRKHNATPSFDEMREGCGLLSKSGVHRMIQALEERGFIRRIRNRARAIEVLDEPHLPETLTIFTTHDLALEAKRRGLVLGHIERRSFRHESGEMKVQRQFVEIRA